MGNYWLYDWLDNEGIRTVSEARKVLDTPRGFSGLVELAERAKEKPFFQSPELDQQLVAGQGMDLTGILECGMSECIKKRVNEILHRTWHYFDKVLVTGMSPRNFMYRVARSSRSKLFSYALTHIDVAFYIREIGAEEVFIFSDRPTYCREHLQQQAVAAGVLSSVEEAADHLTRILLADYKFLRFEETADGLDYALGFRCADIVSCQTYVGHPVPDPTAMAQMESRRLGRQLVARVIGDTSIARESNAALGQVSKFDNLIPAPSPGPSTPADVALNLDLPIIDRLPVVDLLALRKSEAADFQAFRHALQIAINERLRAAPYADVEKVANSVYEDVLEPTLVALDRKINKATELFAKRSLATVSVGVITTMVGLLAFAPVTAPGLAVAVGGGLATYLELLKDKKEVELSDLHFLWKLTEKAASHAE